MGLSRSIALLFVLLVPADRYDNRRSPARDDRTGELTYSLPAGDSENRVTLRRNGEDLELLNDKTGAVLIRRTLTDFTRVVIAGADGNVDDTLTVDFGGGTFSVSDGIHYDGGREGFDSLVTTGGWFERGSFDVSGPGDGVLTMDDLSIVFSNLEPVIDTTFQGIFVISGTDAANAITLDNGTFAPDGLLRVSIDAFEPTSFANKTNVFINGGTSNLDAGDTININFTEASAGLASITVNGDDFNRTATGGDTIFVQNSVAGIPIHVNGGGGDDNIEFANGASLRSGNVDGGDGTDTLNYGTYSTPVSVNLGANAPGLTATLGGDQEVPVRATNAFGTATMTYDNVANTFDITVAVSGIDPATVNGFHIHRAPAAIGGPIIVDFGGSSGLVSDGFGGFTFTAYDVPLDPLHEAALLGGITYVNVHTPTFPLGEIRGQLFPSGQFVAATGRATGTGSISNIENVTGATGSFSVGGTAFGDSLVGGLSSNVLLGGASHDVLVGTRGNDILAGGTGNDVLAWSNGDDTDVMDGDAGTDTIQVNGALGVNDIFTISANGARVDFDRVSAAAFSLDIGTIETLTVNGLTGSDTMTVNSLAGVAGLTTINLHGNSGGDTFRVDNAAGGISVNVNAAGGNDSIVFGTNGTLNGATADGGTGTDTLDYSAYTTPVSVNLGANAPGFTATLGGDQEVPARASNASGTATLTYNNAAHTFDITVAVSGINPATVSGFHIHRAPTDVNGPIIVDFGGSSGLVPDGAGGFTFTATTVPLDPLHQAALLGGITYVNVHTAPNFPGGEIRGQLIPSGLFVPAVGTATGTGGIISMGNVTGGSGSFSVGGTLFGDSLVGDPSSNLLIGGAGNDVLVGARENDTLAGGTDNDVLVWSNGDGTDLMDGDAGNDTIQVNGALAADDVFTIAAGVGGRVDFDRLSPGLFSLDIGTTETLTVNGVTGSDTMTVNTLAGVTDLVELNLLGNAESDTFDVTPSATVRVDVKGGTPIPPPPGDSLNVSMTGTTNPALNATSTAEGFGGNYSFGNAQNVVFQHIESLNPIPDLALTKTDSPDAVVAGTNITYTINLTNSGSFPAANVVLSDVIPTNTTFVSFTAPAGFATSTPAPGGTGTVTASAISMAALTTAQFTLVVKVNAATPDNITISNTASATTATTESNSANNSATATTVTGNFFDPNGDASVTVADVFHLLNFLFGGGPGPVRRGDANGDSAVNVQDVFYAINFLFNGGPAPL